ncbi:hypothetical protein R3P38DRAFT_3173421 [Favolaschia claudopus]|uniref:CRIB domain-containing protein n=1 Tax=Favolaschia claudopus TaxID=2862362 RepID=A0AAW0DC17_9AGAR
MPGSSSPPSTPDSAASQDPPNSPFSPLFASFARLYGASRPHIPPLQKSDSDGPSVPVKARKKFDKSMISSPTTMSFSHLAHVVYDEEKGLVSSGVESPLFDQESNERDVIPEDPRRRRRLSSDSIRSRMSSPTSPSLFSQLANGTSYEDEKGDSEAKVASLTELDRMDRSSVLMPTSSPYRAFTRRESSADEAPSYFDPFAGPEHPSHPHSVEIRTGRPTSIDKSAVSSPHPDSFLHVAHMGHNTAKGIASTGFTHGSLTEIFTRPQSSTTSNGEIKTTPNTLRDPQSLPNPSTTETPPTHIRTNSSPFAPFSRASLLARHPLTKYLTTLAFTPTPSRTSASASILATTPLDADAVASFASSSRYPSHQSPMPSPSNAGPSPAGGANTIIAAGTAAGCACAACVETAAAEGECEGEGRLLGVEEGEEDVVRREMLQWVVGGDWECVRLVSFALASTSSPSEASFSESPVAVSLFPPRHRPTRDASCHGRTAFSDFLTQSSQIFMGMVFRAHLLDSTSARPLFLDALSFDAERHEANDVACGGYGRRESHFDESRSAVLSPRALDKPYCSRSWTMSKCPATQPWVLMGVAKTVLARSAPC